MIDGVGDRAPTAMPYIVDINSKSPNAIAATAPTRQASMRARVPLPTEVLVMIVSPILLTRSTYLD